MENRRGSTLAEMVIVMAVVAVMAVMVVSFTILSNGWVQIGIQRYQLAQDERTASRAMREFVSAFDSNAYSVDSLSGHELTVRSLTDPDAVYTLVYEDGRLNYQLSDHDVSLPVEHVTDLNFYLRTVPSTGQVLVCCTVHYSLPAVNMQRRVITGTYTATVAVRAARRPA